MSQGARGKWSWAAYTGFGALLCASTLGCMNTDKDRMPPPRIGANGGKPTLPPPGLPGIQPLPGTTTPVSANTKPSQPGYNSPYAGVGATGGVQQAGAFATSPAPVQPPSPTIGQPIHPPASIIPSTGPVGTMGSVMPPPTMDYPATQSRTGGSPPPPALDAPVPPPPPSRANYGSNYTPVPPQPLMPQRPSNIDPAQYGNP